MKVRNPKEIGFITLQYVFYAVLLIFTLVPFVWIISSSFKSIDEIMSLHPTVIPIHITLQNYITAIHVSGLLTSLANSVFVAVGTTILTILVAGLASFAMGFLRVRGSKQFFNIMIIIQMFPVAVLIIPLFSVFKHLGLLNSEWGLIVGYMSFTLPVGIILITGYFENIPSEIKDAGILDGATDWQVFRLIGLPLVGPGIVSIGILTFVTVWQELFMAISFISDSSKNTLPITLTSYVGMHNTDWGGLMATSVIIAVPAVVLFLSIQRFLMDSLAGSVKG